MLKLVKPNFEDLSFRKELLADTNTMSYNANWRNEDFIILEKTLEVQR